MSRPAAAIAGATLSPGSTGRAAPDRPDGPSTARQIAVGVLAAAAAVAITVAIAPYIPRALFVASFAAVTIAARYGGTAAGVLAALGCVLGVDYFVIPPVGGLRPGDPTDIVAMAAFVAVAALIGRVTTALHGTRDAAVRAAADARAAAQALQVANEQLEQHAMELELGHQQLQEQAVELEAQQAELELSSQQLQEQQVELEVQAESLQEANRSLEDALADAVRARRDALAAQRAAEAAETQLQAVFAQAPAAVSVTVGPEHRFVLVNARAEAIVGRRDLVGRTYAEAFPAFAAQGFLALLDRVYATGTPYVAGETRVLIPRGAPTPPDAGAADAGAFEEGFFDFVYQPLTDAAGQVTGIMQHAVDVTLQVRARQALAASEARARLAIDAAQLGSWTWDLETDVAVFDSRVRDIFGVPDDTPQPRVEILASRVHPEDRSRVTALLAAAADPRGDGRYDASYRVVRPDGTVRWVLAAGQMTFSDEGAARRPVSLFGTVQDVTAQHAAEAAARVADARFRAVQNASPDGSVVVESVREPDPGGERPGRIVDFVYTYVNPAAERMTGRAAADMLGCRVLDLFPHVRDEGLFDAYVRVVETGEPFVTETEYRHDGMDHGLRVTVVKVGDGVHVQFADVSERVRAAREAAHARDAAEAARRAAEQANQAKAEFLATMSHELRTPLNAIGGYTELLTLGLRGPLTPEQQADLARVRRANQHLTGLVTDLLNFARLEAGQVEFDLVDVPLAPVIADVEALVAPQLAAKGLTFNHDGCGPETPEEPHVARADPEKLRQVLLNLLSNAVKFTAPGGHVALACTTDRTAGEVRLRVTDTGRGIPADRLASIFEPFVQIDRARTPEGQQGVGLGLAISRDLARGMGGDLTVESTPGQGSAFTITLPRA
jgi:PAS domain S-box-containing protein